eukprot:14506-Hanusia_phi.AAC.4
MRRVNRSSATQRHDRSARGSSDASTSSSSSTPLSSRRARAHMFSLKLLAGSDARDSAAQGGCDKRRLEGEELSCLLLLTCRAQQHLADLLGSRDVAWRVQCMHETGLYRRVDLFSQRCEMPLFLLVTSLRFMSEWRVEIDCLAAISHTSSAASGTLARRAIENQNHSNAEIRHRTKHFQSK